MIGGGVRRLVRRRRPPSGRRRRTWTAAQTKHYKSHKEAARILVHQRLNYWNQFYNFQYGRVSIKNTRSRWGSCSSKKNLNFNYRIIFLSPELQDYLIVHELCHLAEMNHGPRFWSLVAKQIPDYKYRIGELKTVEKDIFLRGTIEV